MTDKERLGKARLKEALQLSDQTYVERHPKTEEKIQYSEAYIKHIRELTGHRKPAFYKRFHRAGKSMIGLAATVLIIFGFSVMTALFMNPISNFFETSSSDMGEFPVFQSSQSTQNSISETNSQKPIVPTRPNESDFAIGDHEHEFKFYIWYDENQHFAYCSVEGCKAYHQDYHRYVHKPGTNYLECEFCGRKPK